MVPRGISIGNFTTRSPVMTGSSGRCAPGYFSLGKGVKASCSSSFLVCSKFFLIQVSLLGSIESFSTPLLGSTGFCILDATADLLLEQNSQAWQAEIFLGQSQIKGSPVNISATQSPISASLSFGLTAGGLQMQPCADPPFCDTFFQVCPLNPTP